MKERWCVKADGDGPIGKFFNEQSGNECYSFSSGYYHRFNYRDQDIMEKGTLAASFHNSSIREDYVEISVREFNNIIKKGNPVVLLLSK